MSHEGQNQHSTPTPRTTALESFKLKPTPKKGNKPSG